VTALSRVRSLALVALLAVGGLAGTAASPPIACAAESGPRAALVVDTGSRVLRLCVALDAASVSGIHLIELAGRQHGLSYSLGFGGQAVCALAGVGVSGDDCFAEYPEFWGYWHGDGTGGWSWASSGGGSSRIRSGDVDGWVWGEGDSAATHDRPPATRVDSVCREERPAPTPTPTPEPSSQPNPTDRKPERTGPGSQQRREGKPKYRARPTASPTLPADGPTLPPNEPTLRAARATERSSGPPAGLYVALGAAGALVVGGRIRLKRRTAVR
jgi:hypothetical protein